MNMKRLLTLVALFATLKASAQQVNPVPDYVFANRMSAGRNTVTDTAAYFSIGPRYGATRGMMPPMVVDTASFSANKRNGLLIFSVQKNKFLYWDSVGVKWAEMAGTAGTALTSADTAALLSTRAWRQKGIDSIAAIRIAGSGTINRVPKFTASGTIGNGSIADSSSSVAITILSTGDVGIGTSTPVSKLNVSGTVTSGALGVSDGQLNILRSSDGTGMLSFGINTSSSFAYLSTAYPDLSIATSSSRRLFIKDDEILINTSTDAGNYKLQVDGSIYNTTGAVFAASSGNVGVGTTSPGRKFNVSGSGTVFRITTSSNTNPIEFEDATGFAYFGQKNGPNIYIETNGAERFRVTDAGEIFINTQTDNGDFRLQVNGNGLFSGNIKTAAPPGGTANDWRLGTVATVSPTSPNRTIEVSIGGTIYYIAAKTTND